MRDVKAIGKKRKIFIVTAETPHDPFYLFGNSRKQHKTDMCVLEMLATLQSLCQGCV